MHPGVLHRRFLSDLSTSLFSFVLPLLPTSEELSIKEEVRTLIEKLIKTIEPSARLLSFGSSCNSFGLRNSDMDLVVLIDDPEAALDPSTFVAMIGDLLERETNFDVKPLPKARIPIIKLNLAASPGLPFGIACDIGIENRLAIENTRLLLTYATIDPARVRTLVLFLKVWAKRRRINSPYRGTLSSYGITLMVLFFLVHVKQPPVLPNLQRIAPIRPITEEEMMLEGRNVYFFDDVEMLRQEWSSINFESVGELLIDFFRYFSHDFQFNTMVLSLRAGPLTKESKGWTNDIDVGGLNEMARDRNRLCIEDPFEITYNVARTVTKDGLYTIRGEFMRATRILTQRPERAVLALAELCRERDDELLRAPRSASPAPRTLSVGRGGFGNASAAANGPGWRSQSQQPHDRYHSSGSAGGGDRYGPTNGPGPTGVSERNVAQDMWLAAQGPNLGNPSGLGLGGRGREPVTRAMDPSQYPARPRDRRQASNYDNPNAAGTVSAPLSPSRLYAQLEIGRGTRPAGGSSATPAGPSTFGAPGSSNEARGGRRNVSNSRDLSHPPSQLAQSHTLADDPTSPLPTFAPFSPPVLPSSLHPSMAETGTGSAPYISPSALLSPSPQVPGLPGELDKGVESLTHGFGALGVDPAGGDAKRDTTKKEGSR
ncbi:hypothetical protein VHUM_01906 [Vanrija humicola]|uniref:polynucleotide adenylyltransferase n=1 Tax=Vanrija humicola TaxID=5417 RepID=A0A7D8Z0C3_VANHU|nr:hypothetical protein VHUM_01906 [Vanrija humicola]